MPRNTPKPEAVLIRDRRQRVGMAEPALSLRAAARAFAEVAGFEISVSQWTHIEKGEIRGPIKDFYIAYMAYVVGVSSAELEEVGRSDAAQLLRDIIAKRTTDDDALAGLGLDLTPENVQRSLQERLREIRTLPGVTEQERTRMEHFLLQQIGLTLDSVKSHVEMLRAR